MADVAVPHLAWPFRLRAGRLAVVEQDTLEDVQQSVHAVMLTPRGARPLAPEVGVDDPTFTGGVDPTLLQADLEAAHPLAPGAVTVEAGPLDAAGVQTVNVYIDLPDE